MAVVADSNLSLPEPTELRADLVVLHQGFAVSDEIRERVADCSDTDQLEAWADRAATASSITDIFSD